MFRSRELENSTHFQYLEPEWRIKNRKLYNIADADCSKGEAVVSESRRLCQELKDKTDKITDRLRRQYDTRLGDIDFWRKELDGEVASLLRANDLLQRLVTRLKHASLGCEQPIKVCNAALMKRNERKGIDLVDDEPQKQIQKYLILLHEVSELLEDTTAEAEEQKRLNRQMIYSLQKDINDKFDVICIDFRSKLTNIDASVASAVKFDDELLKPVKGTMSIADWENWINCSIDKAEREKGAADKLKILIEQTLKQSYEDLDQQRRKVINVTNDRLSELIITQKNLDERVGKIEEQLIDAKSAMDELQRTTEEKIKLLDVSRKNMVQRRARPKTELVSDSIDSKLIEQIGLFVRSIDKLKIQIAELEKVTEYLESDKLSILKESEIKKSSIVIDQNILNSLTTLVHQVY